MVWAMWALRVSIERKFGVEVDIELMLDHKKNDVTNVHKPFWSDNSRAFFGCSLFGLLNKKATVQIHCGWGL